GHHPVHCHCLTFSASSSTHLSTPYLYTLSLHDALPIYSYGGAVITNAAAGNPNIRALVFVDAFAPDEGESIGDLARRKRVYEDEDRKSTRLNSSHGSISYAVFCLKKKKTQDYET